MKNCPSCGLKMYYDKSSICEACKADIEKNEYTKTLELLYKTARELTQIKELNQEMVKVINGLLTGDCEKYEFVIKGRDILDKIEREQKISESKYFHKSCVWIGKKIENDDGMIIDKQINDQNMCRLIDLFVNFIEGHVII